MTVPSRVRGIELPPFDPLNLRASELRAAGHDVISLARQAVETREVNIYSTDPGMPALRVALADRLRSVGVVASAADIIITAGANHAFTLALTTMVDPGDDVILPSPYFTNHQMAVVALGANPIEAPVGDCETFSVRWTDIEPHITARTRAVVLCNPGNPTGAVLDPVEGERIVSELGRRNIVVFSDETYLHLVVLGTFSKSFGMMGWRVGFMLADASVCTEAVKIQDAMIICAPVISQMAALGAVREDWGYPESFHEEFLKRRAALLDGVLSVPRLHWTPTNGAFFGFVRVDGCTDSTALAGSLLEEAHVVTLPGASFGRSGEGHLRLSYGSVGVADVTEAMRRVSAYFERHQIN